MALVSLAPFFWVTPWPVAKTIRQRLKWHGISIIKREIQRSSMDSVKGAWGQGKASTEASFTHTFYAASAKQQWYHVCVRILLNMVTGFFLYSKNTKHGDCFFLYLL